MGIELLPVLIASWEIVGRSDGVDHDNIQWSTVAVPIFGAHLRLRGTMRVDVVEIESMELCGPIRRAPSRPTCTPAAEHRSTTGGNATGRP